MYRGRLTTGYKPIEQQQCFDEGGYRLCSAYRPSSVHCVNAGSSRGQVIWQCSAQLNNGISLGKLDVSCETFPGSNPSAGYVIRGSCGLRYTLRRT